MNREELVERLRRTNGTTNACIRLYPEREVCGSGELSGLHFAAKDNFEVAGAPLSFGLKPPLLSQADTTAHVIEKLEAKGASLVASTNLDPAGVGCTGKNSFYGDIHRLDGTPFPWGSSSGSAVLVSEGLVDFALGTDMNGSARLPGAGAKISSVLFSPGSLSRTGIRIYHPRFDLVALFAKSLFTLQKAAAALLDLPEIRRDKFRYLLPNDHSLLRAAPADRELYLEVKEKLIKPGSETASILDPAPLQDRLREALIPNIYEMLSHYKGAPDLPDELQAILAASKSSPPPPDSSKSSPPPSEEMLYLAPVRAEGELPNLFGSPVNLWGMTAVQLSIGEGAVQLAGALRHLPAMLEMGNQLQSTPLSTVTD